MKRKAGRRIPDGPAGKGSALDGDDPEYLPQSEGPQGEVVSTELGEQRHADKNGEDRGAAACREDADGVEIADEVPGPGDGDHIAAEAEEGMVTEGDLSRVARYEVPGLGEGDVHEGHEEKVDQVGGLRVEDKRDGAACGMTDEKTTTAGVSSFPHSFTLISRLKRPSGLNMRTRRKTA